MNSTPLNLTSSSTKSESRPISEASSYARSNPGGFHQSSLSLSLLNPQKTSGHKDFCKICNCSFSLINKKLVCKGCGDSMCYIHSSLLDRFNLERICDHCMNQILVRQAEDEIAEIKQRYSGELSFSILEREEKTRLINKALGRLRKLNIEKKEKESLFKKEREQMKREVAEEEKELEIIKKEVEELKNRLEEQKREEMDQKERCDMEAEDLRAGVRRKNEEEAAVERISGRVEEEKKEALRRMDIKVVKKGVCVGCNNLLAESMPEVFIPIEVLKKGKGDKVQEMSRQICSCEVI